MMTKTVRKNRKERAQEILEILDQPLTTNEIYDQLGLSVKAALLSDAMIWLKQNQQIYIADYDYSSSARPRPKYAKGNLPNVKPVSKAQEKRSSEQYRQELTFRHRERIKHLETVATHSFLDAALRSIVQGRGARLLT